MRAHVERSLMVHLGDHCFVCGLLSILALPLATLVPVIFALVLVGNLAHGVCLQDGLSCYGKLLRLLHGIMFIVRTSPDRFSNINAPADFPDMAFLPSTSYPLEVEHPHMCACLVGVGDSLNCANPAFLMAMTFRCAHRLSPGKLC